MPKPFTGVHPDAKQSSNRGSANGSVPPGHRTKCRKCGAVDKTVTAGHNRRKVRCAYCGGTVARRRAPKAPKIISFALILRHDDQDLPTVPCVDRFMAERLAISFCERGPVARVRVAQIVELLDGEKTGNIQVLRYDNYRGRRAHIEWTGGCEECKGRGTVAHRIPSSKPDEKSRVKFVACESCGGLGGQLNREVTYRRLVA